MTKLYDIRMFRFGQKIACLLPRWCAVFLAECLAVVQFIFAKQEKEQIRKNLRYCGQKDNPGHVFKVMTNYAICMADILRIPVYNNRKLAEAVFVKGLENLDAAVAMNQGVILTTGHIGNWDLAGVYLAGLGYPLCAVTENIPGIAGFFNALRSKTGLETFFPQDRDKIVAALFNKRILALLSDRDLTGWGVRVKFLAGEKLVPIGPAAFATKYNVPILVGCFTLNDDKKSYQVEISEPILPHNRSIKELAQLIADKLSFYIRQNPLQWFVLKDEWLG
ncbi:MAG: lysophospholipid acyltransferase family protein [Candidatus Latescibacteria bacterium]|nr:lysophospholipid acyltransferase family protein [Candidatus Latescibacterota bacterium]